jgi:phosphatidate phosphatase APP1
MGAVRRTGVVVSRVTLREYGGPATPGGGQVLNGEPMPNTLVIATSRRGAMTRVTTDSRGAFVFKLPAGTYSLSSQCAVVTTVQVRSGVKLDRDLVCSVP